MFGNGGASGVELYCKPQCFEGWFGGRRDIDGFVLMGLTVGWDRCVVLGVRDALGMADWRLRWTSDVTNRILCHNASDMSRLSECMGWQSNVPLLLLSICIAKITGKHGDTVSSTRLDNPPISSLRSHTNKHRAKLVFSTYEKKKEERKYNNIHTSVSPRNGSWQSACMESTRDTRMKTAIKQNEGWREPGWAALTRASDLYRAMRL